MRRLTGFRIIVKTGKIKSRFCTANAVMRWATAQGIWKKISRSCISTKITAVRLSGNGVTMQFMLEKRRMEKKNFCTEEISGIIRTIKISVWTGWCIRTADHIRDCWN